MTENTLSAETSPYLLQHKGNPVHWQPWGPGALELAKRTEKPIMLSVGYAACHWCHVMAHESFEDAETAALMNELFVNIKVDREERPDIDTIYQSALALLGQRGGWPLTMFLTPDGKPFWGGTYFPPVGRYGQPGFKDILRRVAELYKQEPAKISANVTALGEALAKLSQATSGGAITLAATDQIAERMLQDFDPINGGIGGAPKFPHVPVYKLIWRAYQRTGNEAFRDAVVLSLDKMCQGGIYDHLGGGFARYATDAAWLVPHFEKMLYDNAQMIDILTLVYPEAKSPLYGMRVAETVSWVLGEMVAEGGGFASTLDADSEGEEGKYYVWSAAETDDLLGPDAGRFKDAYDVTPEGNWEGKSILNRTKRPELGDHGHEAALTAARAILLKARQSRVRPGWDDKVLADWNGLMIAALANAGAVFAKPAWVDAARRAFGFVAANMVKDGRLHHSHRSGLLKHTATLEDYAHMCRAALALFEVTGDDGYLTRAEGWAADVERYYLDENGGYFYTAADAQDLITRTKTAADNATPSGNGVMAGVLARLYFLTGKEAYLSAAEAVIAAFAGELERNFVPLTTLINNNELLQSAVQIVILGERDDAGVQSLLAAVNGVSLANRMVLVLPPDKPLAETHPAFGKAQVGGKATAYVCVGTVCSLPVSTPDALENVLGNTRKRTP
ncbi:MAG: thioredoxin domain-containing protein [Alphaproteobacteria bacterium]|nr:thioredoxin domain-containing protein [Alphaproteobacteria bacterium]